MYIFGCSSSEICSCIIGVCFLHFHLFFVFPYQAFLNEEKVCCSNICFRITCFSFSFYLIMIATWTLFIIFATHSFLIFLVYIDLHEDSSIKNSFCGECSGQRNLRFGNWCCSWRRTRHHEGHNLGKAESC